jgi:tRNA threonylcarbamoyladenosine biosynthesis protein TsaE
LKNIDFKYHLDNIDSIANQILEHLDSKVILFDGAMGSGKTTLINALIKAMQSSDIATSPTFSIVNEYQLPDDKVYHFDFYRIESVEEAYNFGVEDYLTSNHWLFIEWPERISEILPEQSQTITITELEDSQRSLKLTIDKRSLTENNAMTVPKF